MKPSGPIPKSRILGLTGLGIVILTILLLLLTYHLMQRPQQGEAFADTDTFAIPPSWQWTEKAQQHERARSKQEASSTIGQLAESFAAKRIFASSIA